MLRPGGVAVFCEPWGENPALKFARNRLPYRGQGTHARRGAAPPVAGPRAAGGLPGPRAPGLSVLLDGPSRSCSAARLISCLDRCDRLRISHLPALERYCRYVVLDLRRPATS